MLALVQILPTFLWHLQDIKLFQWVKKTDSEINCNPIVNSVQSRFYQALIFLVILCYIKYLRFRLISPWYGLRGQWLLARGYDKG